MLCDGFSQKIVALVGAVALEAGWVSLLIHSFVHSLSHSGH